MLKRERRRLEGCYLKRGENSSYKGKHDVLTWDVSQELGSQQKRETQVYIPLYEP